MLARPTFEVSPQDARARNLQSGDFCRLYNDRGETFGYARVVEGLRPGVLGAPKQIKGSRTPGGVNVNALVSQRVADMGDGPVFYSTLAQLEKVTTPTVRLTRTNALTDKPPSAAPRFHHEGTT